MPIQSRMKMRTKMKKNIFQEILNECLSQYKEKTAIEYGNHSITYHELNKHSNYLANWILSKGIKQQDFIAILLEDRSQIITSIIGILKAGCIFVPMTSDIPIERLETMINESNAKMVITDKTNIHQFKFNTNMEKSKQNYNVFTVEDIFQKEKNEWFLNPPQMHFTPEDKIYIYFTSGTTGKPKAILGMNKSLLHFIQWEIETFNISTHFRISQLTTPIFDAFLRDVFVPLFAGGVICIPKHTDTILNSYTLSQWLEDRKINLIHCVPSLFRLLNSNSLNKQNFKTLKFILLSGEKINPKELENWYDIIGDRVQLVNLYGATETTMIKSYYFIQPPDTNKERIPIGKPIRGCRIIVCDENMKACDKLVIGEIYVRTPFRTFGYYNDSNLNKEKFIKNPFSDDPNDLLYKSGDMGRFLPDGNIELLSRIDRQIKIRGIRIEPEEIEDILCMHPSVTESVVIMTESSGNSLLLGFISPAENNTKEDEKLIPELKTFLSEKIPEYMVPDKIIRIDKIPRTINGKINYESLVDIYNDDLEDYAPPQNELEKKLLKIWMKILGLEESGKIGRYDNFFETGGNSLNVMALLSKIHREFNVRISLGEIFNNPSIEKQAQLIQKESENVFETIQNVEKKDYYPLSPAQQRLYVLQQMNLEGRGYNMSVIVRLEGKLNNNKLEAAFQKLIQRHENLRTSFQLNFGEPVQRIHSTVTIFIENFTVEKSIEKEEQEKDIVKNFSRPFDLNHPPLMRVGLVKIEVENHLLMVEIHHIISDGISLGLLIDDFISLYKGDELPLLKLAYKDYVAWLNSERKLENLEQQEAYWLKIFESPPSPIDLQPDYERPAVKSFDGNRLDFEIERETLVELNTLAQEEEVTLFMLILAFYNVLLGRLSGIEDIVIGIPSADRPHDDLGPVIGMMVNTLALRNFPKGDSSFVEFLRDIRRNTLNAFENQDYQFETLVKRLGIEKRTDRNPLFDVFFVFQNLSGKAVQLEDLKIAPFNHIQPTSQFDLRFICTDAQNKLYCSFEYCTKLFKREKVERFISYFNDIIKNILKNRKILLKDISFSHNLETIPDTTIEMDFNF